MQFWTCWLIWLIFLIRKIYFQNISSCSIDISTKDEKDNISFPSPWGHANKWEKWWKHLPKSSIIWQYFFNNLMIFLQLFDNISLIIWWYFLEYLIIFLQSSEKIFSFRYLEDTQINSKSDGNIPQDPQLFQNIL